MEKNKSMWSKVSIVLSAIAVVLSAVVSFTKVDILGLAGTQWILIGVVLGIYALYLGCCNCGCCVEKKD